MNTDSSLLPLSGSFWQKINFFNNITATALKDLLFDSEVIGIAAKKNVFYEGECADHFGFVINGVFKLYRTNQLNQRVIMDFVTSGDMIAGLLMAANDSVYPVTVQALVAGNFLKIPKSTYDKFWYNNAEIMKKLQIASLQRVKSLQTMREAQRWPLEQRVAWALIKLFGKLSENNIIKVCFSRSDMADTIGAAPESVIRVFGQWANDGIIEIKNDVEYINLALLNEKFFKAKV